MARGGLAAPGQREQIVRGERTNPLTIAWQALWALIVFALAFLIFRGYIAAWEWITDNHLHSWLMPPAIIAILVCLFAGCVLVIEIADPNWPNPRDATQSTRPLFPWSRERTQPRVSNRIKVSDLLSALDLEMEEDDESE